MSEQATKTPTAEETRDKLAEAVWEADRAWYNDIGSTELRDAYRAAKAAFRDFENAALDRGATETCHRCGGAGGWKGWPGYTCFNCGGHGREAMRKTRFQAAPNTRRKNEAKAEAEMAEKDQAFRAALADLGPLGGALKAAYDARRRASTGYDDLTREQHFRADIASKLWKYGSLSEAQLDAVRKGLEREAALDAEREAAGPLEEGAYEITGEILTTKWQENERYGTSTLKMLVKLDNGNKVWGTKPRALDDADKGDRIMFTAEVERSADDEHFGFFKSPKGARIA